MLYVETSLEVWQRKYRFEPQFLQCPVCKNFYQAKVPIIIKGYAGLEIEEHECGRAGLTAVFKPTDQKEIKFWNSLYD